MFKYFSVSDNLSDVFNYIKTFEETPKIIISDLEFLNYRQIPTIAKNVISNAYTIDFFVITKEKDIQTIQYELNDLIDTIYVQDVTNSTFFMNNTIPITKINNIISINHNNDFYTFIFNLINDNFYRNSFEVPIKNFILFSSISSIVEFLCKFKSFKNTVFILKPNEVYDLHKIITLQTFIENLLK